MTQPLPVLIESLTEEPDAAVGQRVTVIGEIGQVFGPNALALGEGQAAADDGLLVVAQRPIAELAGLASGDQLAAEDVVLVSGTVRRFSREEIGREIGAELDAARFGPFEGWLVLIAERVEVGDRAGA